ncbi:MAG: permease [Caldisericum exile]|uniref:Permease n=1 Tax=Caldisericum exile TaxID=693075 RepID=A0A2J6X602_9BACT|nr:MAG: permease [Caldisericum exile]
MNSYIGYIYLAAAAALMLLSYFKDKNKTKKALITTGKIALNVLPVLFFIFILMGVIQLFVTKELVAKLLGTESGIWGILIGEIVGAVALIEPAAVFPFSCSLIAKGATYGVIYAFVSTAVLIGIATLPAEITFMGKKFTVVRNILSFVLIFLIALTWKLMM